MGFIMLLERVLKLMHTLVFSIMDDTPDYNLER